jgi:rod shape-determining protein MreB
MIVDIGGGTTEVAVISLSGMVVSRSLDVAGDEMDDSIVQYFRRKYNLLIGDTTAEEVKIKIGSVFPTSEEQSMEVKGRDQVTGLPKTITITSEEVRQSFAEPVKLVIDVIKETLEETPAELSADLVDRGIVLAGGGALLRGLPELLSQETELPVHLAPEPLICVALGAGKYLEEIDNLKLHARNGN